MGVEEVRIPDVIFPITTDIVVSQWYDTLYHFNIWLMEMGVAW